MSNATCRRRVIHKNWEGLGIRKEYTCGRTATHADPAGLALCERHYNRWKRKMDRKASR